MTPGALKVPAVVAVTSALPGTGGLTVHLHVSVAVKPPS